MIDPKYSDLFTRPRVRKKGNQTELFDESSREWVPIELGNRFVGKRTKTLRFYQKDPSGGFRYDADIFALLRKPATHSPNFDRPLTQVNLDFFEEGEEIDADFITEKSLILPEYTWLTDENVYENYSYYSADRNHVNQINAYNACIYSLKEAGIDFGIETIDLVEYEPKKYFKPHCFYHNGYSPKLPFYFRDANEMCYFWDTRLRKPGKPTFIQRTYAVSRRFQQGIVFNGIRPNRDQNRYGYSPFLHFKQYIDPPYYGGFQINRSFVSFINAITGVTPNTLFNETSPTYLTEHHPAGIIHCLFEAALLVEGTYKVIREKSSKKVIDFFFIADSFRWVTYEALSIKENPPRYISSENTPSPRYTKIIVNLNFELGEFDDLFRAAILESPRKESKEGYLYQIRGYKPSFYEKLDKYPFFASKDSHTRIGFGKVGEEVVFYGERVSPFIGDLSIKHLNDFESACPIKYPSHYNLQVIAGETHSNYDSLTPFIVPHRFLALSSIRKALTLQDMGQRDFNPKPDIDLEQQKISFTQSSLYSSFSYFVQDRTIYKKDAYLTEILASLFHENLILKDGENTRPVVRQIQQLPSYFDKVGGGTFDYFENSFWFLQTENNPTYPNKGFQYKDGFTLSVSKVNLKTYKDVAKGIEGVTRELKAAKVPSDLVSEFVNLSNLLSPFFEEFFLSKKTTLSHGIIKEIIRKWKDLPNPSYGDDFNSLSVYPYFDSPSKDLMITLIGPNTKPRPKTLFYLGFFQGFLLPEEIAPNVILAIWNHDASNCVNSTLIGKYMSAPEKTISLSFDVAIEGFELEQNQEVIDHDFYVYRVTVNR